MPVLAVIIIPILLFAAYGIFSRYGSPGSGISFMQKKDVEALEITCKKIMQSFSKCRSHNDMHDEEFLYAIRKSTQRTKHIDYNIYASLMGELWADYYNKKSQLFYPTPKTNSNEYPNTAPVQSED